MTPLHTGQYWEDEFRFKREGLDHGSKVTDTYKDEYGEVGYNDYGEEVYETETHEYKSNVKDYYKTGYTKEKGGWTSYIRLVTFVCLLLSPVLVLAQFVSLLIAIFNNPYKGSVISWYGDCSWCKRRMNFFEKILHFLVGIVIVEDY